MNFIAGFLFLSVKDEALAFVIMKQIIAKFSVSQLFSMENPKLKLMFYQMDRLISILLPDLHAHLKVSKIIICLIIVFELNLGRKRKQQFFLI
jgi:hypothetical protein